MNNLLCLSCPAFYEVAEVIAGKVRYTCEGDSKEKEFCKKMKKKARKFDFPKIKK